MVSSVPRDPSADALAAARDVIARGGVVAVATDTLYGLAADATRADAVAAVFALKGRDFRHPLPVVVRDWEQAQALAARPDARLEALARAFWPGPLTLVVPAAPGLPEALTAGTGTLAMRQPDAPFLAALLRLTKVPLTATSANRSGLPAARTAAEVAAQLTTGLSLIVDSGTSPTATPSTILDLTQSPPRIVRAGVVSAAALAPFLAP